MAVQERVFRACHVRCRDSSLTGCKSAREICLSPILRTSGTRCELSLPGPALQFSRLMNGEPCRVKLHSALGYLLHNKAEGGRQKADSCKDTASEPDPTSCDNKIRVGAYYYPWYGSDFHHGQGYVRRCLRPPQGPALGQYNDQDPRVIGQHMQWSRHANVSLWVTSWWGPRSREDNTIRRHILEHPSLTTNGDMKIALLYETTGRILPSENYSLHRVDSDLEYISRTYFSHPNYYRIDSRPVLFVYLTRIFSASRLEEIVTTMRDAARRGNCDAGRLYVVGDQVWADAPSEDDEESVRSLRVLDAVTNYDVYGNLMRNSTDESCYAGMGTVERYHETMRAWKLRAKSIPIGFMPSCSPGFNDRGVRLGANHRSLSRRLAPSLPEGSLFAMQLLKSLPLIDHAHAGGVLMITSWNEWHEDTQCEPVAQEGKKASSTNQPCEYTNGVCYEEYGTLYLDLLRVATNPRHGFVLLSNENQAP